MKLLTKAIEAKLVKNFKVNEACRLKDGNTKDFKPVLKLFNPCGSGTWLISELDPEDNSTMFGLSDLGMGSASLGYVSLAELTSVRLSFGLGIERDLSFKADKTLGEYAKQARLIGRIQA